MPIPQYAVLAGRAVDRRFATTKSNHYEIKISAAGQAYRIAVNVQSADGSEVLYGVRDPFAHPMLAQLGALADGHHPLPSAAGGLALDYVRGEQLTAADFVPLPATTPGDDNDLNDRVDTFVERAISQKDARVYAFGSSFFNPGQKDQYFNFKPAQGIHDVHMNQGNSGSFAKDDGVFQDGALLFHYPSENRWAAIFLAFQSQSFQTDNVTGHATTAPQPVVTPPVVTPPVVTPPPVVITPALAASMRIIAALANSIENPEIETVTLLNASPSKVDLSGWVLADKNKNKLPLAGALDPGAAMRITVAAPMQLSNKGGSITLIDAGGKVVDGVSYSHEQANTPGWTIVF
jgi:uncharacterized protein YukJ